jgi:hypothetical protein
MSDVTPFHIGAQVTCQADEEVWGRLDRVVVEPLSRTVTHLVVAPRHGQGPDRLVPVSLVGPTAVGPGGRIALSCTRTELEAMDPAEETRFLPGVGLEGYDPSATLGWPFYGLVPGGMGTTMGGAGLAAVEGAPQPLLVDRIPAGEVELHRGDRVRAVDGEIGRIRGLAVDPATRQVTHVLLDEGHLWGRKQVAIPLSEIRAIGQGRVEVSLTRDEIRDLPPVELATMSPPGV